MHLAIIDDNDKVFVEYDPDTFLELLMKYTEKYGNVRKAYEVLSKELRDKIRNM